MFYARTLLAALLVAVLAACGGPTAPPTPPDPTIAAVTPAVAPRGTDIVVAGTDFGTSGTLSVGGVEATVTSWTDTEIEATLAGATPDGWQDVVVSTADGTDDFSPFFVGVEYSGAASGLQAFLDGLDKGTAVLLQAQTYDLSASTDELIVDNHGLFGRGEAQTKLKLSLTDGAIVLSDWGASVTIADLSIESDGIAFIHGTVIDVLATLGSDTLAAARLDDVMVQRTISLPSAPAVAGTWTSKEFSNASLGVDALPTMAALTARFGEPRLLTFRAFAHTPELALAPAGLATPKITLRNVNYAEVAGGGYFGIPPVIMPSLDLTLTDVTIAAADSMLSLFYNGNLALERVDATVKTGVLLSYAGALSVVDSTVESATDLSLGADAGITVSGSTVRVADGSIDVIGAANAMLFSGPIPAGGAIEIVSSTVEALDGNLADANVNGGLAFVTQFAPIGLTDNVSIRSHDSMTILTQASTLGEGDITLAGNSDVRAGVFKSEDALNFRPTSIQISTSGGSLADTITLDGNTISATLGVVVSGGGSNPGFLFARHNALTAGDGENNGVMQLMAGATGRLELEDNTLSTDSTIVVAAPDLLGTTAALTGNVVAAVGDAAAVVVAQLVGGSCEVSDNTFEAKDVGADDSVALYLVCGGADPLVDTFTVAGNELTASGDAGSAAQTVFGSGTLSMSSNQVTAAAGFQLTASDVEGVVSANDVQLRGGYWAVTGDSLSNMMLDSNVVAYDGVNTYGLAVSGVGSTTVTGNGFTVTGPPSPTAVALAFGTSGAPIVINASGNTFTNFSRALYVSDVAVTAWGVTANIQNNVFDFTIDAAPKVAELSNVKSAIDARNNQWGTNTSAATVAGYVLLSGDTPGQGGSISLSPITLP